MRVEGRIVHKARVILVGMVVVKIGKHWLSIDNAIDLVAWGLAEVSEIGTVVGIDNSRSCSEVEVDILGSLK